VKTTYTKEEIADQEKKEYDLPPLLPENGVAFDIEGVRYGNRFVQGVDKFIVNVKMTVAQGHDGLNTPGAGYEDARFFALGEDGEIDENGERYGMNIGQLRKLAFAAFGGKSSKDPGGYPMSDNGEFYAPWVALEQFASECGQIVADVTQYAAPNGKVYVNLKKLRPKE
jgi:hypothetical protein